MDKTRFHKLDFVIIFSVCLMSSVSAQTKKSLLARADQLEERARVLYDNGHYDEGIGLEIRVLSTRTKLLGPRHYEVALTFDSLAALYEDSGDYPKAERLLNLAYEIVRRTLPPEHPYSTRILYDLASMYDDRGDYSRAKEFHERALMLREQFARQKPIDQALSETCKRSGGTLPVCEAHKDVAESLNDLGVVYEHEGDYTEAEKRLTRALEISGRILSPEDPFLIKLLNNIAVVFDDKGEFDKAEEPLGRVLRIRQHTLGQNHPSVASSLNNLASHFARTGNLARAEELFNQALEIGRQLLPENHLDIALILSNLAGLRVEKNQPREAVELLTRATTIQEHHLSLLLSIGSEKQKQLYVDSLGNDTNQTISLHVDFAPQDADAARLALTTILQRKGRSLDAMTDQFGALRTSNNARDRKLFYQLQEAGTRLANRQISGPSEGESMSAWRASVLDDSERVEQLEAQISNKTFDVSRSDLSLIDAIRNQIPADAALIEFFKYLPFNPSGRTDATRWGQPHYLAYVLKREMPTPQVVRLGPAVEIDEEIKRLRPALRNPNRDDYRNLSQALYESVLAPLIPLVADTRHLLLSPDGELNVIPFAALVDNRGEFLVKDFLLTYLTSGRDLLRLEQQTSNQSKSGPLIIADPAYDMKTTSKRKEKDRPQVENRGPGALLTQKFSPLLGTRTEAAALVRLFPGGRVLTQKQATEGALKRTIGPRILHIATHGFFVPSNSSFTQSTDRSSGGQMTGSSVPKESDFIATPLLLSGLALAGANHLSGGHGEDGILTGLEAARLNLSGTKLVVLSACETGLGDVRDGAGVYGLRRAFVLAGSESQLMSIWKVNDETTRDFMVKYYKMLLGGYGKSESLRRVQLELLSDDRSSTAHPYYWAGFILSGQWGRLPDAKSNPRIPRLRVAK